MKGLINKESMSEVDKITDASVKAATVKMKARKSDGSVGFNSNCLIHGLDILFSHLATIFRGLMVHGTVTSSVLAGASVPSSPY